MYVNNRVCKHALWRYKSPWNHRGKTDFCLRGNGRELEALWKQSWWERFVWLNHEPRQRSRQAELKSQWREPCDGGVHKSGTGVWQACPEKVGVGLQGHAEILSFWRESSLLTLFTFWSNLVSFTTTTLMDLPLSSLFSVLKRNMTCHIFVYKRT